jgi:hypothetical protein
MQLYFRQLITLLLLVGLGIVVGTRGIVPAVTKVDTDFPNYFTAAKIVANGGDVSRLYDDQWFQEQMRHYQIGRPSAGKFSPFPPPTALLMVPLTRLTPLNALRVMTVLSLLGLAGSIVLLGRILAWRLIHSSIFILLSGYAVINALRLGQPYILISASCILGYYARLKGRPFIAGLCFGLFSPIKYFPIVILVYFAFHKEWRIVLGGATAIVFVALISIGVMGWKIHQEFLFSVLGNHLTAHLSMQNPFTASFQSFDTLFRRLFVYDAASNPRPFVASARFAGIAVVVTKCLIAAAAALTLVRLNRRGEAAVAPSLGLLGIVTLLLAPATATYHFSLLWLPVGLLIRYFVLEGAALFAYFALGAYALIGFFPYGRSNLFEGRGALGMLAFPRLFLLLAMFVVSACFLWRSAGAAQKNARSKDTVPVRSG